MNEQDTTKVIDAGVIAGLRELAGDDDPGLLGELVGEYLADAPARLEDLVRSLDAGDVDGLGRAAHSLKSSSAYMGALAFAELCREIEEAARRSQVEGQAERVRRTRAEFLRVREALRRIVA